VDVRKRIIRYTVVVVRKSVIISMLLLVLVAGGPARSDDSETAARFLQSGKDSYRAGHYSEAVDDLRSAAEKFVGLDEKQLFIDTGNLPNLPQFEESLVYLALAYSKLGRDSEAGDTVERLLSAERISPTYSSLPLTSEVADFEPLAARLVPFATLPPNAQLARAAAAAPTQPQTAIAEERTALFRAVSERPVEATALPPVIAKKHTTPAKKHATPAKKPVRESSSALLTKLRKAESRAAEGDLDEAGRLYLEVATAPSAPREMIGAAAAGLYRVGAYDDAVAAFKRLGAFARGEEDLRYYDAVSLYETGNYQEARKQLACALPYVQVTDDVARYRTKIEQSIR
jgi:tetratricopeptide (TPR) repeat protein